MQLFVLIITVELPVKILKKIQKMSSVQHSGLGPKPQTQPFYVTIPNELA
jgi:hypothetical protein